MSYLYNQPYSSLGTFIQLAGLTGIINLDNLIANFFRQCFVRLLAPDNDSQEGSLGPPWSTFSNQALDI